MSNPQFYVGLEKELQITLLRLCLFAACTTTDNAPFCFRFEVFLRRAVPSASATGPDSLSSASEDMKSKKKHNFPDSVSVRWDEDCFSSTMQCGFTASPVFSSTLHDSVCVRLMDAYDRLDSLLLKDLPRPVPHPGPLFLLSFHPSSSSSSPLLRIF